MSLQAILYLFILIVAAVISASLAWYTWRQRQTTGAIPFSLMMLVLFLWGTTYLLQITSTDALTKLFWSRITFLSIVATPVVWFLFALEYTGRKSWITRTRLIILFIVPVLTTIVIWTNDTHHWFWISEELMQESGLTLRDAVNGFWFWVHAAYSYALIFAGTVMIVRTLLRWPAQYRGQMIWILLAVFAPWIANAISIFNLLPLIIDITPFAFTLTGLGMAFALFRHKLLDLVPIARDVVIEGMLDGIIVLDTSERVVDINQATYNILNLPDGQHLIGAQLSVVFTQWPQLFERYKASHKAKDEIPLGEGKQQRWIGLTISPLQDEKAKSVGSLVMIRDITLRKKAEEQVRQLSRAVESSPTSIVITDTDGNIQYANPKFTQVTGYTLEETLGKNPNILKTDQTPVETHRDLWETVTAGKEWRGEFCNRKKNGELYWELASISPVEDDDGNISFYVAVKEDITEQKRAQDALHIAYDQALEASRAKSQLLAKVSHELRTPLGGILGYAELLRDGGLGKVEAEQEKAAESIVQSAHHLTAMVNELLDEAQIQAKTAILQNKTFSPVAFLQQSTAGLEITAQKKGVRFTTSIDPNLPPKLYGDEHRLMQILINLAGNAIKFTTEGEVRVDVQCPDPGHWVIQVTDSGIGIPQEAQASIFEPFKQADNAITNENRGIGLGLSITKQLVELMGGRLMFESQVGKGSMFSVLLPIVLLPPQEK